MTIDNSTDISINLPVDSAKKEKAIGSTPQPPKANTNVLNYEDLSGVSELPTHGRADG